MKRTNLYLLGIIGGLLCMLTSASCKKDEDPNAQQNAATQTYTGVLIGSTGAYELNLNETGAEATVVFDDETYELSTRETLEDGQRLTLSDGNIALTIEAGGNGNDPAISFAIPGHTVQSTVVLSNPAHPNQNYIGWTERLDGLRAYRTTFNLTLHNGNEWTGLERVDLDLDPTDPDHQSTQGEVARVGGTYTESDSRMILSWSDSSSIYNLFKVGDRLSVFHEAGATFQVELAQVQ